MIWSLVLQVAGLIGLPVGGYMVADIGGGVIGASIAVVYIGLAVESERL